MIIILKYSAHLSGMITGYNTACQWALWHLQQFWDKIALCVHTLKKQIEIEYFKKCIDPKMMVATFCKRGWFGESSSVQTPLGPARGMLWVMGGESPGFSEQPEGLLGGTWCMKM